MFLLFFLLLTFPLFLQTHLISLLRLQPIFSTELSSGFVFPFFFPFTSSSFYPSKPPPPVLPFWSFARVKKINVWRVFRPDVACHTSFLPPRCFSFIFRLRCVVLARLMTYLLFLVSLPMTSFTTQLQRFFVNFQIRL